MASKNDALIIVQGGKVICTYVVKQPVPGFIFAQLFVVSEESHDVLCRRALEIAGVLNRLPVNVGATVISL